MSYKIIIPQSVYFELNEAAMYYEQKQPKLGEKFILDWETTAAQLSQNPLHYQKKYKKLRSISLTTFPYIMVFEIEGKEIIIYRLIHAQRNPKKIFKK